MHNKKLIIIILILVILLLILNNLKYINTENFLGNKISNEAIQNISTVYSSVNAMTSFNNINITGNLNAGNFRGIIVMWNGITPPPGWVLCNGTNGTPDLRGRFILGVGQGGGLTNRNIGERGGEENHVLNINEIPAHSHVYAYDRWGGGSERAHNGGSWGNNRSRTDTTNTGGNQAHNNMPPYYVLAYIMKT